MLISELEALLKELRVKHGDCEVFIPSISWGWEWHTSINSIYHYDRIRCRYRKNPIEGILIE